MLSGPVRFVFAIALRIYRSCALTMLRLRGLTPADPAERRVVSGEAWDEFCDMLKASGAALLAPGAPTDPFDQAEGYRYLSRLARAGLENFLECSDVNAPRLCSLMDGYRDAPCKLGSDNPDNMYQNATIDGRLEYVVSGTRGTVPYLGFGTQTGQYGGKGGLATVAYIEAEELVYEAGSGSGADARFGLVLSETRPENAPNWLALRSDPPQALFIVRQTFGDRRTEVAAELSIRRMGGATVPVPLTPAALEAGLQSAGVFVAGASAMFAKWAHGFQPHTNQLPLFDQERSNKAGGDPNIRYYHSYWLLLPGEALVIRARPPPCRSWNFQLNNHWMESLDYRYHPVHTNSTLARYDENETHGGPETDETGGRGGETDKPVAASGPWVTIVVAHTDPNVAAGRFVGNWVSTVRHGCGTMCFRWVAPRVGDDALPQPRANVVRFDELVEHGAAAML